MSSTNGPVPLLVALGLLGLLSLTAGCGPEIGDPCTSITDCSQQAEQGRFCDTTQPGGYCSIFNCQPDSCPDSVCVAFNPVLDPACVTADDASWPRFERTFCMATCDDDSDCRSHYSCVALPRLAQVVSAASFEARGAIVDKDPQGSKVCLPAPANTKPPVVSSEDVPGVCLPGGDGGAGGAGGAGGIGGD